MSLFAATLFVFTFSPEGKIARLDFPGPQLASCAELAADEVPLCKDGQVKLNWDMHPEIGGRPASIGVFCCRRRR